MTLWSVAHQAPQSMGFSRQKFWSGLPCPSPDGVYAAVAKSLQLCPTLCDPLDSSPPGSPVPGILQARTLEWVAISFSNAWKWIVKGKSLSCVWLLATPWTAAHQAPPSMGFSRQEYWSGVPLPSLRWCLYPWIFLKYSSSGSQKQQLSIHSFFHLISVFLRLYHIQGIVRCYKKN